MIIGYTNIQQGMQFIIGICIDQLTNNNVCREIKFQLVLLYP